MISQPLLNACLNGASAVLIIAGYFLIRRKNITAHRICMVSACLTSLVFLISYIHYHLHHGVTHYQKTGLIRLIYFSILISHTLLAAAVPFLVAAALFFAVRGVWPKHRAVARVTLPVWLYVSVTGVVIYWMIYKI